MFYLSLCVTLFFVFLNHALCLESKLCNVSFIMEDDIICDCSARGLKSIPRDCPGNTTQLIMTGNNLHLLDNDAFINFPKLQYLNMENCKISKTGQTPFTKLDLLRELNINNNPLSAFQWNILKPLVTLQTLRISHDLLATYPEQSWIDLSNITHVFTNGGPTKMFGNVFTAMESLNIFRLCRKNYKRCIFI